MAGGVSSSNGGGASLLTPTARPTGAALSNSQTDAVAQQFTGPLTGVSTVANFDGQAAQDTFNTLGVAFVPPDTNGAVGATQFVQMVNVTIAVYDKNTAKQLLAPVPIHSLWDRLWQALRVWRWPSRTLPIAEIP
jgi:hypothetical protein